MTFNELWKPKTGHLYIIDKFLFIRYFKKIYKLLFYFLYYKIILYITFKEYRKHKQNIDSKGWKDNLKINKRLYENT